MFTILLDIHFFHCNTENQLTVTAKTKLNVLDSYARKKNLREKGKMLQVAAAER